MATGSNTSRFRTKEANEIARLLDTLPADAREYAVDMIVRVIGVPIPEPRERRGRCKVIQLFPRPVQP